MKIKHVFENETGNGKLSEEDLFLRKQKKRTPESFRIYLVPNKKDLKEKLKSIYENERSKRRPAIFTALETDKNFFI